jgi:acyl-CoA synthetase (AMP-forming)/AMP-acid ligase II
VTAGPIGAAYGAPDPERARLDGRVLAWIGEADAPEAWRSDDARFEALALELFAFQFERCAPYRRFCEGRSRTPDRVSSWLEIPAVPTGAFKEMALRSFPPERERHVFRTSGTTTARRGELHLDTLALYEASLRPTFRRHLLPDLRPGRRARLRVLAPAPAEAPDSSLSHMFGVVLSALGDDASGFDVRAGELRAAELLVALEKAATDAVPVALCGTAFAFVHLLDHFAARGVRLTLPGGSRVMETGGFKGRSRVLPREELYGRIEAALGIGAERIVNQYGMTELASQFYDSILCDPGRPRRKLGPPWARVRLVDPESGAFPPPGAVGLLEIVDLANTGSIAAVQTADLGRAVGDGFEVLGRAPDAEARGCSIAADEMLDA